MEVNFSNKLSLGMSYHFNNPLSVDSSSFKLPFLSSLKKIGIATLLLSNLLSNSGAMRTSSLSKLRADLTEFDKLC